MKTVVRCFFSPYIAFQQAENSRELRDEFVKGHAFFTLIGRKIARQVVSFLDIYVIEADGLVFKNEHYLPPVWAQYIPILYRKLII